MKQKDRSETISLYLDIETRWRNSYITVVGFFHEDTGLVQHIWPELTAEGLADVLPDAERIYTYNGNNFDLKVMRQHLGIDLLERYKSRDLMYDCWSNNLKGGLKAVEEQLGIGREVKPLSNTEIQQCWTRWKHHQDEAALKRLLKYNEEDVMNLVRLRELLGI
jgi:hypothetical protein